jgi:hypothetical protein
MIQIIIRIIRIKHNSTLFFDLAVSFLHWQGAIRRDELTHPSLPLTANIDFHDSAPINALDAFGRTRIRPPAHHTWPFGTGVTAAVSGATP